MQCWTDSWVVLGVDRMLCALFSSSFHCSAAEQQLSLYQCWPLAWSWYTPPAQAQFPLPILHHCPPYYWPASVPRRCAGEIEELNHSVMAAAELLLQHASSLRSGIQELSAAAGQITREVTEAEALLS
jgi:hypothetical protein